MYEVCKLLRCPPSQLQHLSDAELKFLEEGIILDKKRSMF